MEENHNEETIKLKFDEVASIIEKGDSNELRCVLESGRFDDINESKDTRSGPTLLMIACMSGFIDCVKILLDHNADINSTNNYSNILSCACFSGDAEMVRFIIASGLEINDRAIMNVFKSEKLLNNTENISILIDYMDSKGISYHGTLVYWASRAGNKTIVRLLLERGADPNKIYGGCGDPLVEATRKGHIEVVKLLLAWDAIDKPISQARLVNALKQAASKSRLDIFSCLFEYGINAANTVSVLTSAIKNDQLEVVKYLIDNGVDVHIADIDYYTPLTHACRCHFVEMVRLLVAHGIDPNASDSLRVLPLQASLLYLDVPSVLLEAGADPNIHFADGSTALLDVIKSRRGHPFELTLLLLQHGADPNLAHAETGFTPLMASAYTASIDLIRLLLEYEADVTQVDREGKSVLEMLGNNLRYTEVVKLCKQYIDINRQGAKLLLK